MYLFLPVDSFLRTYIITDIILLLCLLPYSNTVVATFLTKYKPTYIINRHLEKQYLGC